MGSPGGTLDPPIGSPWTHWGALGPPMGPIGGALGSLGEPLGPPGTPGYDKGSGAPAPSPRIFIVFVTAWAPGIPEDPLGRQGNV